MVHKLKVRKNCLLSSNQVSLSFHPLSALSGMNYTLNQLQIFLKVARTGSVTRAAQELHLTQPAVSIQLRNFQDQFDIPLTEPSGRKIAITEFGRVIAEAAERILNEVEGIQQQTLAYQGLLTGRLRISVVSTGKYVMPYFLSDFVHQHPGVEWVMDVTNKEKVVRTLEENEVDFSLVSILPEHLELERLELLPNKLFLVGRHQTDLSQVSFIYRENGSGTRRVMERFLSEHSLSLARKIELTSNEAVKQAVLAGLGVSLMPLIGIKNELQQQELSIIPFPGLPLQTMWSLVWLKGKKHSPAAVAFLQHLHQQSSQIVERWFHWYGKY